eukprot:7897925-Pyramimonas_sp.AAC.1
MFLFCLTRHALMRAGGSRNGWPHGVGLRHTLRSKRPGRSSAGSSRSARLVAPMKMTPVSGVKPSISVSSWFRVCSRSSLPRTSAGARFDPSASISSTKIRHLRSFKATSQGRQSRRCPIARIDCVARVHPGLLEDY